MNRIDNFIQPIVNKLTHWLMLFLDKPRSFIRFKVYGLLSVIFGVLYAAIAAHQLGIGFGVVTFLIFGVLTYVGNWSAVSYDVATEQKGLAMPLHHTRFIQILGFVNTLIFTLTAPHGHLMYLMLAGYWMFAIIWSWSAATPPNPPAKVVLQTVSVST